ncbi:hypothetical protein PPSIR1_38079 [Plesiocystis pacifica SIR-1]|uniref:PD-(D/E)XK nuclease domain-containing protein n=1 Tax=Plesiocystis pacifica SIR-1 TaxID=391625 RepID=A6G9Q5_9BACT|nr:PD-(D/E)XK nuclease superfamily protein [Plesiocystis pacifica]EDM77449.1 hypothetical protein PPSIR1_38079 [Plesiocystis pacifica SIR-1]
MKGDEYRDRVASYIDHNFSDHGLLVYTEVTVGKSIIGKRRKLDVFIRRASGPDALGLECKYQRTSGTTDEKIPYALQDLDAMWIPGCLVYAGTGWSTGVLHTLDGSRRAAFCDPAENLARSKHTLELDHVIAATFGLWDAVIPEARRFKVQRELELPSAPLQRADPKAPAETKQVAKGKG